MNVRSSTIFAVHGSSSETHMPFLPCCAVALLLFPFNLTLSPRLGLPVRHGLGIGGSGDLFLSFLLRGAVALLLFFFDLALTACLGLSLLLFAPLLLGSLHLGATGRLADKLARPWQYLRVE